LLYCPSCGLPISLENHSIAADGTVTPSVVEVFGDKAKCGECGTFHESIKLEGWKP